MFSVNTNVSVALYPSTTYIQVVIDKSAAWFRAQGIAQQAPALLWKFDASGNVLHAVMIHKYLDRVGYPTAQYSPSLAFVKCLAITVPPPSACVEGQVHVE